MLLMILEQPIFIVCYYIDIGNTVISELNKNDNSLVKLPFLFQAISLSTSYEDFQFET